MCVISVYVHLQVLQMLEIFNWPGTELNEEETVPVSVPVLSEQMLRFKAPSANHSCNEELFLFLFFFLSLGNRELLSVCCLWAICSCCLKNGAATEREALSKHDRPCISIKLESVTNITSLCSYEAGEKTGSLRRDCNKSITSILFIYFYLLRPSASWLSQSQWRGEILTFFIWNYV